MYLENYILKMIDIKPQRIEIFFEHIFLNIKMTGPLM